MANVYGRVQKISNAVGRSDYLTDKNRQEEVVLHKENMRYSWAEHSAFEEAHQKTNVANNIALEVHVALPNELDQNREKLEKICDDLVHNIVGENKDYEYAVHWNHARTNLHLHILFSERECQTELEPKVYKKDIWHDKDTHKLAKANAENAVLVHRKGDIQKNKDGSIKYQTDIFKAKDRRFIESSWVHEKNRIVESVMKSYGYNLEYRDQENPYLSQKKLYKGASEDYLEKARAWNTEVKRYNEGVKEHIELEPIQLDYYMEIKTEIVNSVKEANSKEKKITPRAIEIVRDMSDWIHETLLQLKVFIKRKAREIETLEKWKQVKDKFADMFNENKNLETEIRGLNQQIDNYEKADRELTEVIESKKHLVNEIENYQAYQEGLIEKVNELEHRAYKEYSREEYLEEIKDLSYEERIDKAQDLIKEQRKLERGRSYGFER